MVANKELRKIASSRQKTAKLLLDSGDYLMAVYMMGMCLEISLKALICKKLNLLKYPENHQSKSVKGFFKTHNFSDLVVVAGMTPVFTAQDTAGVFQFWSEFTSAFPGEWVNLRYMADNANWDKTKAENMHKVLLVILKEVKKRW